MVSMHDAHGRKISNEGPRLCLRICDEESDVVGCVPNESKCDELEMLTEISTEPGGSFGSDRSTLGSCPEHIIGVGSLLKFAQSKQTGYGTDSQVVPLQPQQPDGPCPNVRARRYGRTKTSPAANLQTQDDEDSKEILPQVWQPDSPRSAAAFSRTRRNHRSVTPMARKLPPLQTPRPDLQDSEAPTPSPRRPLALKTKRPMTQKLDASRFVTM